MQRGLPTVLARAEGRPPSEHLHILHSQPFPPSSCPKRHSHPRFHLTRRLTHVQLWISDLLRLQPRETGPRARPDSSHHFSTTFKIKSFVLKRTLQATDAYNDRQLCILQRAQGDDRFQPEPTAGPSLCGCTVRANVYPDLIHYLKLSVRDRIVTDVQVAAGRNYSTLTGTYLRTCVRCRRPT